MPNLKQTEEEEIIINSPKIITHTRLNVKCDRGFYCNASNCESLQMRSPTISHSYHQMQSFLLSGNINKNKTSSNQVQIQYWGDSIQTTLECDMRQWLYEISLFQRNRSDIDVLPAISSSYHWAGCPNPGQCDKPKEVIWENLQKATSYEKADVIVFTLGSHYEFNYPENWNFFIGDLVASSDIELVFRNEIFQRWYDILQSFLMLENKTLLIRGPSPTHFDTENGLANLAQRESLAQMFDKNASYQYCSSLRKMPDIVIAQEQILRLLVDHLQASNTTSSSSSVAYIDVYELTRDRYWEHTTIPRHPLDCKHYCQNCGILRAWNMLIVDYLMSI